MISALEMSQFKCFQHLRLPIGKLTLLTGFNGGGKSSSLQPLLFLSQALQNRSLGNTFPLNGDLVQLGTAGDVINASATINKVGIIVEAKGTKKGNWQFSAPAGERHLTLGEATFTKMNNGDVQPTIENLLRRITFISAVRGGPSDSFPMPSIYETDVINVGVDGRFAAYWYDQKADYEAPNARKFMPEMASSFRIQFDHWLGSLFPEAQVNVTKLPEVAELCLRFRLAEAGAWRRPANVGYGLTYSYPILVALLAASDEQIIIIDSPEAHLHPAAQSKMGHLLARFAAAGVQIIVETHSDHLLNGVRIAVRESLLAADDVLIHFFTGADDEAHGVVSPSIDCNGRMSDWPEGFFDQNERDLSILSDWS